MCQNDLEEWKEVLQSFQSMGRTEEEIDTILSVVAGRIARRKLNSFHYRIVILRVGVLLMGNVEIKGGESAEIVSGSKEDFNNACRLLYLDAPRVEEGICVKISSAGSRIKSKKNYFFQVMSTSVVRWRDSPGALE